MQGCEGFGEKEWALKAQVFVNTTAVMSLVSCRYSTSFRSACLLYRCDRARTPAAHVLFKKNLNLMENFLGTLNLRFISLLPHEKLFTERRANCTLANLKVANERQVPRSLSHLLSTNLLGDEVVMSCLID